MPDQSATSVLLSVDMKKYRIRVHKSTLHQLGDPPFIQLLINPSACVVALKSVSRSSSGDQAHRVSRKKLASANSIEIYSKFFIDKLNELIPDLNDGCCYRMTGSIIPSEKLAVFSFKTLTPFADGDQSCQ